MSAKLQKESVEFGIVLLRLNLLLFLQGWQQMASKKSIPLMQCLIGTMLK